MKILKPGKNPEQETFQTKCLSCSCVFEFERHEAKRESTCRNEDYLKICLLYTSKVKVRYTLAGAHEAHDAGELLIANYALR